MLEATSLPGDAKSSDEDYVKLQRKTQAMVETAMLAAFAGLAYYLGTALRVEVRCLHQGNYNFAITVQFIILFLNVIDVSTKVAKIRSYYQACTFFKLMLSPYSALHSLIRFTVDTDTIIGDVERSLLY
jgi:hypothetical protein